MKAKGTYLSAVVFGAVLVVAATALPAFGQGTGSPRGFVGGMAGVTFGTVTDSGLAGQFGMRIGGGLHIVGEVGRLQDVLPKELSDKIDNLIDLAEDQTGLPVTVDVGAPATYGMGGLRWSPVSKGRVFPFVEGGLGVGHVRLKLELKVAGVDMSDEVWEQLDDEDTKITKLLMGLGGGVNVRLNDTASIDVGYRYFRVFTGDPVVHTSMVYGAVKYSFGR